MMFNNDTILPLPRQEEIPHFITLNPPPQREPLLSKNEYIALEMTKAYIGERGCHYQSTVIDAYDTFLKHLNGLDKEEKKPKDYITS